MCAMRAAQLTSAHTGKKPKFLRRTKEGFRLMECLVSGEQRGGALAEVVNG